METVNEIKKILDANFESLQLKWADNAYNRSLETINKNSAEINNLLRGLKSQTDSIGLRERLEPSKPKTKTLEPLQSAVAPENEENGRSVKPKQLKPFLKKGEGLKRFEVKPKPAEELPYQCDKKKNKKIATVHKLDKARNVGKLSSKKAAASHPFDHHQEGVHLGKKTFKETAVHTHPATMTTTLNVDSYISQLNDFIANNFSEQVSKSGNENLNKEDDSKSLAESNDYLMHQPGTDLLEQIPQLERRLINLLTLRSQLYQFRKQSQASEKNKDNESALLNRIDSIQQELKGIDDRLKTMTIEPEETASTIKDKCFEFTMSNGDHVRLAEDKTFVYKHATSGVTQTIHPDGLKVIRFGGPDGQTEKCFPDGRREIVYADCQRRIIEVNGIEETHLTDGRVVTFFPDGREKILYPDGSTEYKTQHFIKREYPNGNVKTKYTNGCEETMFANGRVRFKNQQGVVLYDYHPENGNTQPSS